MTRGRLDLERRFLNKWEMYQALKHDPIPELSLPQTMPFSIGHLGTMLSRWKSVYVKPNETWGGMQISKITKTASGWTWTLQGSASTTFTSINQVTAAVAPVYSSIPTIVQRAAPVATYHKRPVDIRILMQRDASDRWVISGMLARIGGENSIVSNVAVSQGEVKAVADVLPLLLVPGSQKQVQSTMQQIRTTGEAVCHVLDTYTPFNEVGIDLGVAKTGKLWLFEVNTDDTLGGPSHELFKELPDKSIYESIEERSRERNMSMIHWLFSEFTDEQGPVIY